MWYVHEKRFSFQPWSIKSGVEVTQDSSSTHLYIGPSFVLLLAISMASVFFTILLGITAVQASASRQSVTALMTSQIDTFSPYTYFASAAYCTPSTTLSWSCGGKLLYSLELGSELDTSLCVVNCNNNAGFQPVASGGDGDRVQYCEI